jgi:hypothetical protein
MSDLRSAPVPPLRDDDHVRDGENGGPLVVFYDADPLRVARWALERRGLATLRTLD